MNMKTRKTQGGFTLIELVIVIVILGILAAVAVPRFIDLSDEAAQAAVNGVAGSLSSAFAINFAGCSVVGHDNAEDECVAVSACSVADANLVLQGGLDATRFAISQISAPAAANGSVGTCRVTDNSVTPNVFADFQVIVAGQ